MANSEAGLAETRMVHPVFPADANHYGSLFGGQAMAWMDQAAFICATRWCRQKVVTVHSSAIDFHIGIPLGMIVELVARIVKVGTSSMTVDVKMWIEPMDRQQRQLACEGTFVLIALANNGKPIPVPALN